nr:MAG TPA: hypothetical protein [Caudoviricetes sp.]
MPQKYPRIFVWYFWGFSLDNKPTVVYNVSRKSR